MLSTSAFKFNVRRYTLVREAVGQPGLGRVLVVDGGRDLHSSTFRLNVSAF
jgi:regulator of RNase E activity RraA